MIDLNRLWTIVVLCTVLTAASVPILAGLSAAEQPPAREAAGSAPLPAGGNASAMTDIHDIKPALAMDKGAAWPYWVVGCLVALALAGLGRRLWMRMNTAPAAVTAPPVPPEVEAYAALDALAADREIPAKQFYFRLSFIVRRYMERRFSIPAAEMTAEELLLQVDRLPLGDVAEPLKAFCLEIEPIKFAGVTVTPERLPLDLAFARDFVHRTTKKEDRSLKRDAGRPAGTLKLAAPGSEAD